MAESASSVKAGKAYVEISAKDNLLVRGLKGAQQKLKAWGESIQNIGQKVATAGTLATGGFVASLKHFATEGDMLSKMSQRTGLAVEALSGLNYAANQSGTSLESLERGIKHIQKEGGDASLESLMGFADELAGIEDPGERAARALEIFGKSGTELLPLMGEGSRGLRELIARHKELGIEWTGPMAKAATVMGDNLGDVWAQAMFAAAVIGSQLAPIITDLAIRVQEYMKQAIAWIKANKDTIILAAKVAVAVTAVGAALIGTGLALKAAALAAGALAAAIKFILSPIGLALVAFAAVVAAIESVAGAFGSLSGIAGEAMKGIVAALAKGDVEAAMKVVTSSLTLIWERWAVGLQIIWEELKSNFFSWLDEMRMGALEVADMLGIITPAERNRGINDIQGAGKQRRKELDQRMLDLAAASEVTMKQARTERDAAVSKAIGPSSVDLARTDMYGPKGRPDLEDLEGGMRAVEARGTFNKFSTQGLEGGGGKTTEKIEKNTRDLGKNFVEAIKLLGDIKLRLPAWG